MKWEIKPLKDGYAIYKDDVYVMWCYDMKWAEFRLQQLKETRYCEHGLPVPSECCNGGW